jgi:23S rRNA U2552 (ribose-2'-O)-methylase RlmE/FtsJ
MSYFILPRVNFDAKPNNIKMNFNTKINININKSLSSYLKKVKEQINPYLSKWDNVKKYTNPYEYIHTCCPGHKFSVSRMKPLSRSFFKLIEIYNTFKLEDELAKEYINSFHLAEGPGGFIEALVYLRNNPKDRYIGMTLMDENSNIPGWKKSEKFLKKNTNVKIEKGIDGTGNLYNTENLKYCIKKYKNSMDIITADGGFDFSIDFNKQEEIAFRLIFSQIAFGIAMQKKGGTFILKVFDIFLRSTVEIIYLLSSLYESVYVVKPNTSRYANSEKYLVCKKFKYNESEKISKKFVAIFHVLSKMDLNKYKIISILNVPIQYYYLRQIEEMNAVLGQQQIENILQTIKMIEDVGWAKEHLNQIKIQNIKKCVQWCIKNNVNYNKNIQSLNMFLGN